MRVVVNLDLCQGHAQCEDVLPEVFSIGPDGKVVLLDEQPSEELRHKVEEAVRLCPVDAILIED